MPPAELFDNCVVWPAININTILIKQNDIDSEFGEIPGKFVMDETSRQKYFASLIDDESTILQNILTM